jgi:hypothetical protein
MIFRNYLAGIFALLAVLFWAPGVFAGKISSSTPDCNTPGMMCPPSVDGDSEDGLSSGASAVTPTVTTPLTAPTTGTYCEGSTCNTYSTDANGNSTWGTPYNNPDASTAAPPATGTAGGPAVEQNSGNTFNQTPGMPSNEQKAGTDCQKAATDQKNACGTTSTVGMSPEMMMLMMGGTNTLMGMIEQQSSAKTAGELCALQAGIQSTIQMLTMYKMMQCNSAVNNCQNKCTTFHTDAQNTSNLAINAMNAAKTATPPLASAVQGATVSTSLKTASDVQRQAIQDASNATELKGGCVASSDSLMAMMMMQQMGASNAGAQAQDCAGKLALATPVPNPVAAVDCTNAAVAASSSVCLCQANPNNPICGALNNAGSNTGGVASTGGTTHPFVPGSGLGAGGIPVVVPSPGQGQTGTNSVAGGGGGGLPGGGSGGSSGSGSGDAAPSNGVDKNVITGQSNGGGGGGTGGALSAAAAGGARAPAGAAGEKDPNFKGMFPNKKDYANRGLAGMTVQAVDGITGPLGPSLFEKVTNRMQVKIQTRQVDPNLSMAPGSSTAAAPAALTQKK